MANVTFMDFYQYIQEVGKPESQLSFEDMIAKGKDFPEYRLAIYDGKLQANVMRIDKPNNPGLAVIEFKFRPEEGLVSIYECNPPGYTDYSKMPREVELNNAISNSSGWYDGFAEGPAVNKLLRDILEPLYAVSRNDRTNRTATIQDLYEFYTTLEFDRYGAHKLYPAISNLSIILISGSDLHDEMSVHVFDHGINRGTKLFDVHFRPKDSKICIYGKETPNSYDVYDFSEELAIPASKLLHLDGITGIALECITNAVCQYVDAKRIAEGKFTLADIRRLVKELHESGRMRKTFISMSDAGMEFEIRTTSPSHASIVFNDTTELFKMRFGLRFNSDESTADVAYMSGEFDINEYHTYPIDGWFEIPAGLFTEDRELWNIMNEAITALENDLRLTGNS